MTFNQRVEALAPLGFTPRQTRFLVTVALHSGYCLRRQYAAHSGLAYGKNVRNFLDTLVSHKLATRFTYRANRGHLYHLFARSIYRALDQEDDRHRRHASPALIARRLMLLDAVLAQPNVTWLATSSDKLAYFREVRRIPATDLPRAANAPEPDADADAIRAGVSLRRYFGHKLPIGLVGGSVAGASVPADHKPSGALVDLSAHVQFVYLATEPGAAPFERFLRDHAALLRALPAWTVAVTQPLGPDASPLWHSTFLRVTTAVVYAHGGGLVTADNPASSDPSVGRAFRPGDHKTGVDIAPLGNTHVGRVPSPGNPRGHLVIRTLPYRYDQFGAFAGVL